MPLKFGFVSVKELIDHAIAEGNRLFAGTRFQNTWCIYHDALKQWWEKGEGGAQEYLKEAGLQEPPVGELVAAPTTSSPTATRTGSWATARSSCR